MFLLKSEFRKFKEECQTFRRSDVAVDSRPRFFAADQALFGGEQSHHVRAASCGVISSVCTLRGIRDLYSFLTALLI